MVSEKKRTLSENKMMKLACKRGGREECYPDPIVSDEVAVNKPHHHFWHTLNLLHSSMGTKFMIPAIGEKMLDLHLLYVEVTNRGGFQKVVESEQWSEISQVFGFSPTASISNYLVETYTSLLLRYEQVYFLKPRDVFTPNSPAKVQSSTELPDLNVSILDPTQPDLEEEQIGEKPTSLNDVLAAKNQSVGIEVPDLNVSISNPSRTLQEGSEKGAQSSSCAKRISQGLGDSECLQPNQPKRPHLFRTAPLFFLSERYSVLKSFHLVGSCQTGKVIYESWKNLGKDERKVYEEMEATDRERYRKELEEYNEKLELYYAEQKAFLGREQPKR